VKLAIWRRGRPSQFQRAADGSMALLDHLRELRSRLFKAALGIAAGFGVGMWLGGPVMRLLKEPYCKVAKEFAQHQLDKGRTLPDTWQCPMLMLNPTDGIVLWMQIALWLGLIVSAPIWLYQLWAFVAPGLHRNERRWAYWFAGIAAPLFAAGAVMAFLVVGRGLEFLLRFNFGATPTLEIKAYFSFITGLILLFGLAFEFPLLVMLFNIAGIATYKRLLGWWRIAVFVFFAFSAVAIPTGDPFTMSALGLGLTALYFGAVLFAYVNDKRRDRRRRAMFGDVGDDEISPLEPIDTEPVGAGMAMVDSEPIAVSEPVAPPRPLDRRYDDMT
jgi:sec-independent protein translocase protein TatC